MDLKDFFPSCTIDKISRVMEFFFNSSGNRDYLEKEFYECTTKDNHLFIGSPVSGTIANAITSNAFNYLNNICKKYDISLSVFADDITFSSNKFISSKFVGSLIEEAFKAYKLDSTFKINDQKSVGFSGCHRKVTGVSINENNKITISQKYFKQIRTEVHHLSLGDMSIDVNKLRGKIAYATMLDDSGKLYRYLKKFEPTVKQFSLCSDGTMEKLKQRSI